MFWFAGLRTKTGKNRKHERGWAIRERRRYSGIGFLGE